MTEDECKKILDAIIDMWYQKLLNKMASNPFPSFEEALEEIKKEMLNDC